ncbi:MAG: hypothetical protein COT36_04095 [Parcubacteria group bacterium CG08_land_8_20_14_0_20_38_56]|nr:MAG: hypothetical protein COT36_04095 [Parcubacteria group bacterium CG08_land_8_20_14_0_20_38_56]
MGLLIQIIGNSLGIYLASCLISGFSFQGNLKILILAGFILGIVNFFLKPILKIISFPLIWLTFGFFSFVISALLLWLTAYFVPEIQIEGILPLCLATILISVIGTFLSFFTKK